MHEKRLVRCTYSPHSLRATTATLPLGARLDLNLAEAPRVSANRVKDGSRQ